MILKDVLIFNYMKTKTKIAIYARVSTKDQNPDSQLTDLRRYAQERGFEIYQEYIVKYSPLSRQWGVL